MSHASNLTAAEALERLKRGNEAYLSAERNSGDISPALRQHTALHGQSPYAIILTCSDSRVIPESIFSAGIGELSVIRTAGNIVGLHELGSIEYAAEHLGCRLAVVLGHTNCGAVGAALAGDPGGYIRFLTEEIRTAVGEEADPTRAACLNVRHSVERIEQALSLPQDGGDGLQVRGALYHIDTGLAEFL